jgi:hypothetical protein
MKTKIDLFAAALVEQSGGQVNAGRGRGNHRRYLSAQLGHTHPRRGTRVKSMYLLSSGRVLEE